MIETYDIDGNKLKSLLRINGYNAKEVSSLCGHHPQYLSVCICRKRMTLANARMLESVTGIPLEAYAILPEGGEAPKRFVGRPPKKPRLDCDPTPHSAALDTKALTEAVRNALDTKALTEAVRNALSDERTVKALAVSLLRIALEGLK